MKYVKFMFCFIFIVIISFFFLFTIRNNNEVSLIEKRKLTTFPDISINSILNGSYFDDVTLAFSDQLVLRNYLVKGYFLFQFQKYNGDVAKGKNNELYAAYQRVNNESSYLKSLKDIVPSLNKVALELGDTKFIFLSIPRKDAVMISNLPDSYISSIDIYKKGVNVILENKSDSLLFIDGYDLFNNNSNDRYFYINDHHITPRAASLLYNEVINVIDDDRVSNFSLDDLYYVKETIVNGSFNNQIGQSVKSRPEELYLVPKFNIDFVRYEDLEVSDKEVLGVGNTYSKAYMGGDRGFTIVDTNRDDLPNILYVGSSFTNILEALSVHDFNKMVSIDYRHNNSGNSIKYYVDTYDIDYVVFVPSQSNNALAVNMIKKHLGM